MIKKNIKKIVAAALIGTAMLSTTASATTYQQNLEAQMKAKGAPDSLIQLVTKLAGDRVLTEEEATKVAKILDTAFAYVDQYKVAGIKKNVDGVQSKLQKDVQKPLERALNISIIPDSTNGLVVEDSEGKQMLALSIPEINKLGDDMSVQGVRELIPTIVEYSTQKDKNAEMTTTPDPTKPDPTKPDPTKPDPTKPTPTPVEKNLAEQAKEVVADATYTEAQKTDFNKAQEAVAKFIQDRLNNVSFYQQDLDAVTALVNDLPAGPARDKLLALLKESVKDFVTEDGKKAVVNDGTTTTSTPAGNTSYTSGTTAKTATNFGNAAVAGLGLMAVAGTIFVISKKKIV